MTKSVTTYNHQSSLTMDKNGFLYLLFTGFLCSVQFLSAQPNSLMDQGILYYQNSRFDDALREFERVRKNTPDDPEVYAYIANTYFKKKDYTSAENFFSQAIDKYYQILKNSRQADIFRDGQLTILEPGSISRSTYALLYNNRGATRLKLNKSWEAIRDFEEALNIDPGLVAAKDNLSFAKTGEVSQLRGEDGFGRPSGPNYTYTRPISVPQPVDPNLKKQQSTSVRQQRAAAVAGDQTSVFDVFKPKPFVKRSIPSKGKAYKLPAVDAVSHNYLTIQNVRITPTSTFVTIKVHNDEGKPFDVSIADKNSEDAFFITDRTGSKRLTFKMKNATGISFYPRSTELRPGESIEFTLEFPKIPDDLGYINLIEGNNQMGQEWNFYNIDLTK